MGTSRPGVSKDPGEKKRKEEAARRERAASVRSKVREDLEALGWAFGQSSVGVKFHMTDPGQTCRVYFTKFNVQYCRGVPTGLPECVQDLGIRHDDTAEEIVQRIYTCVVGDVMES